MGADMLILWVAINELKDKNHDELQEQLLKAVEAVSFEQDREAIELYYDAVYNIMKIPENVAEVKREFGEVVEETFKAFAYRDVTYGTHKGDVLYITGGLSWGDSPTDSYVTFEKFIQLPQRILALLD